MPSQWQIARFDDKIRLDDEHLMKTSLLKWSYNAKPDLVVELNSSHCICIEAKFESDFSQYPTKDADRKIFDGSIGRVGQLRVQRHIFECLDLKCSQVVISKDKLSPGEVDPCIRALTWSVVFQELSLESIPKSVRESLKELAGESSSK